MNKFLALPILFFAITSQAALSKNCRNDLAKVIEHRRAVVNEAADGRISGREFEALLQDADDIAQMVAITCASLKVFELQKTAAGRLHLISQERANKIAAATRDEALNYYNMLKGSALK